MAHLRIFLTWLTISTAITVITVAPVARAQVPLDLPPGTDDGQALLRELPAGDGTALDPAVIEAFADAATAYGDGDFAAARTAWEGLAREGIGAA